MNRKLKFYSGLVALFLLGSVIGSLITGIYFRNKVTPFYEGDHKTRRGMILERLNSKLNLTPIQKVKVEAIIDQTQKENMAFNREFRPQKRKMMEKRFSMIREILDPEQQEKLDEFQERLKHRMGRHRGFRSIPEGPPSGNGK